MSMSSAEQTKHRKNPYMFVLWGQKFDAVAATVFAVGFRRAGIRTKIVGIHGPASAGQHGLMLRTDMLLGEAISLTDYAVCVVLPCDLTAAHRLKEDPRLMKFLAAAAESGAQLVVSSPSVVAESELSEIPAAESQWLFYGDDVMASASAIAGEFAGEEVFG